MRADRLVLAAASLAGLASLGVARAQNAPRVAAPTAAVATDAVTVLARGLAVLAAERGPDAVRDVIHEPLPPALARAAEALAKNPRFPQLQAPGMPAQVKRSIASKIIDETEDAKEAIRIWADDAGTRLARELDEVGRAAAKVRDAAKEIETNAAAGKLASVAAVESGKGGALGPFVLRSARTAPSALRALDAAATPPDTLRAVARVLERQPDPVAEKLVALLPLAAANGAALATGGNTTKIAALSQTALACIDAARDDTRAMIGSAGSSLRALRTAELAKVLEGARGPELDDTVKRVNAYMKAFGQPPALEATDLVDVYGDRNDGRWYFWLEGEERWEKAVLRADSPAGAASLLRDAHDPRLASRASDPRAISRLYASSGAKTLDEGLAKIDGQARAALPGALRAIRAAERCSVPREALALALGARGVALDAIDPGPGADEAAGAKVLVERWARALIDGGPEQADRVLAGWARAAEVLARARVVGWRGLAVEAPAGVALRLRLDAPGARALLALPEKAKSGDKLSFAILSAGDETLATAGVEAWGFGLDGEPISGRADLPAAARTADVVEGGALAVAKGSRIVIDGGTRGARVAAGERLVLAILPPPDERVAVRLSGPGDVEALTAPLEDGRFAVLPSAAWPAGSWTARAFDVAGAKLAETKLEVEAAPGIVVKDASWASLFVATPGQKLNVLALKAGEKVSGALALSLQTEVGGELAKASGDGAVELEVPSSALTGRYRVAGTLAGAPIASARLLVAARAPVARVARDPFDPSPAPVKVAPGEPFFVRIDGAPLEPGDAGEVEAKAGASRRIEMADATGPATATMPALDAKAAGRVAVEARLGTLRGDVLAKGELEVGAGRKVDVELRDGDGRVRSTFAPGETALARLSDPDVASIVSTIFILITPDGRPRVLPHRGADSTSAEVAIPPRASGALEVRAIAATNEGQNVWGSASLKVQRASALVLAAPKDAVAGQEIAIDVAAPAGFAPPLRVRVAPGAWVEGTTARVIPEEGDNAFDIQLEDSQGRAAMGRLSFKAGAAVAEGPAPKDSFGLVLNVGENASDRALFTVPFVQLSPMVRGRAKMPERWVVVAPGPFDAARARDETLARAPYDGPPASEDYVYRSARFFSFLAPEARRRAGALGMAEGDVVSVKDSPTPGGEESLADLVRRHIEAKGGWVYDLEKVVVRAAGALPEPGPARDPKDPLRFENAALSAEGASVGRIEAPGPLADLSVRPQLPRTLALGKPIRIAASAAAVTTALVAGRVYPGNLETVAKKLLLAPSVELSLFIDKAPGADATVATVASRVGGGAVGVEALLELVPQKTEKWDTTKGAPRRAEVYDLAVLPRPTKASGEPLRFLPVPPGTLDARPRTLTIVIKAQLGLGLGPADWPADRPRPEPRIFDGAPVLLGPADLPPVEVEIEARYARRALDPPPPPAAAGASLGDVGAELGHEPRALPAIDAAAEIAGSAASLEKGDVVEAERRARRALLGDPDKAAPWSALADAALARRRNDDAIALARRAATIDAGDPRAAVVEAEALLARGKLKDARAALKRARRDALPADLGERLRRAAATLGE